MKSKLKKWLRPFLFTIGGALVGLGYYYAVDCSTGSCPITSNPIITMIYMGFLGLLISGISGQAGAVLAKARCQIFTKNIWSMVITSLRTK